MRTLLVEKYGKPHHPFPRSLAPYPINYEKALLDAYVHNPYFCLNITHYFLVRLWIWRFGYKSTKATQQVYLISDLTAQRRTLDGA